jgi:adenosylcobinamide-GDP ribazoletransferase
LGFLTAVRFLTLIPIPGNREFKSSDFGNSLAWFPVIGLLLGAVLFGLYLALNYILPTPVTVIFVIIALTVLTGAHHLDGLMDTFDGMVSSRTKEERLAIMADHHTGAFGVIAVVLLILLKFAVLYSTPYVLRTLLLMPVLSRWLMVNAIYIFPCAKPSGMGYTFKQGAKWQGLVISTIIAIIIAAVLFGWHGLVVAAILWLITMGIALFCSSLYGGLTGDNYGAVNEIAEVMTAVLIVVFHGG